MIRMRRRRVKRHPGKTGVHADIPLVAWERPEDDPPLHRLRYAIIAFLNALEGDVLGDATGGDV